MNPSIFEHLFGTAPIALGLSRLSDGHFIEVNDAFLKLHGYSRSEVIGHTSHDLRLWNNLEERNRMLAGLRRRRRIDGLIYEFRHKSGNVGRAMASVAKIEIDGTPCVLGALTDIRPAELAQQQLRESERKLGIALKASGLLTFIQDRKLRYTWIANPALGLRAEDAIGRTDAELGDPESVAPLVRMKRRVMHTGRADRQEFRVARGNQFGWFDLIVEPNRNAAGLVTGVICAASDITERKHADEALAAAHQKVRELTTHLRDATEVERSALARDVHDQVGAVLTGMRMQLASLADTLQHVDDSGRVRLDTIIAMTHKAMEATRDICSQLRPASLDDLGLAETCRWYVREWSAMVGIRTVGRYPRRGTSVEPDSATATDLFRILQELLTNVTRHSGATSVRVTLSTNPRHCRLRVVDDGCGFDVDSRTAGFGLVGIKERADNRGGRVRIDSGESGTSVTVVLEHGEAH